jgi:drug/metabolite transporter (DMT)-like permease
MFYERTSDMNQLPQISALPRAWIGPLYLVLAGVAFAAINIITQIVTGQLGFKPTSDAFWQYFIALLFSLPFLWKHGVQGMATKYPWHHVIRVIFAALGVQAFIASFAHGVPIWQIIALVMTSPFFIILGARIFLGETVGLERWLAAVFAFAGAMIVLQPWSDGFSVYLLLPIMAAILWGASSLVMKRLTNDEPSETITVWLLLLLTPINFGLSAVAGFEWPSGQILWLMVLAGVLVFIAQYMLAKAYAAADASFLQPFDDIRLPLNIVAGYLAFGYAPGGSLWLGIAMILAASLYLLMHQRNKEKLEALKAA